jgi:hypothetical protein
MISYSEGGLEDANLYLKDSSKRANFEMTMPDAPQIPMNNKLEELKVDAQPRR